MRNAWGAEKAFEFLWEASATLSSNRTRVLTHIIRYNYGDMLGSRGDGLVNPELSFDFSVPRVVNESMVERYSRALVDWSRKRATVFQGPHLAVWGSDFRFVNASSWFDQMDLVIAEINSNPSKYNATVRYTTLSQYFDHLHSLDLEFPIKKGVDFEYGMDISSFSLLPPDSYPDIAGKVGHMHGKCISLAI